MLYQFMDWRMGLGRRMLLGDITDVLSKLRAGNNGKLPFFISSWDEVRQFCNAFSIPLHENDSIASSITYSEIYPSFKWLKEEYDKFIKYLSDNFPELLIDPKIEISTINRPDFLGIIEGSVSNTEEKPCLEVSRRTLPTSSILTDSQNSSVTATRQRSQPPQP